ncbi:TIR domain-containing protein [Pseudomonas monteilii]|uniref:TIR domain-containing protein n=1 Tax=Pseudomonas monteilii TaxID=76759 RepID=UPI000380BBCE|nr:nucleotide-binding protein [Pseudomonas monteilii]MBA6102396.1 nucleotide-binding protein [Pseudomonas monteilii]
MTLHFLQTRFEKVSYLQNLLIAQATGKPADSGEYQQLRHELLSDNEIASHLPSWLKLHRDLDSFWGFIQPKFGTYAERRTYISEQFTPLLDALEQRSSGPLLHEVVAAKAAAFRMPEPPPPVVQSFPHTTASPLVTVNNSVVARNKRNVFIVHGRDNEAKLDVSRFIESIGLKAIILHEQANSGMTIIEKIEHYAGEADFALVLYTPCDQGRGYHERQEKPKDRARQNVVFEHGYLMAKLGRENVCALVKGTIETPNDISGVVYVSLDQSGAWQKEIVKELRACGYTINNW